MNTLDKKYTDLLQDILDNGTKKQTRNGEVLSVFGRQIRHKMSDGFPLLTTKKMAWKQIVTELLWFLRGDTNIKYLVDNDCHIWDGDAYKNYDNIQSTHHAINEARNMVNMMGSKPLESTKPLSKEEFINKIKTDDEFAKKWGELGPVYGKQWRDWGGKIAYHDKPVVVDQIANLINDLKTNPDSRRLLVNSWNVGELSEMVLPPCHYGFQVYTRELSLDEKIDLLPEKKGWDDLDTLTFKEKLEKGPQRAISLMWNQRSVDTPLGLPFNIASYGLLLEIIAKMVNMVPDELIGNLGDCHIYSNQIEGVKEQIGRKLSLPERMELWERLPNRDVMDFPIGPLTDTQYHDVLTKLGIPKRTREPFPLPKLNINTEFWPTESGECGVGPIDAMAVVNGFSDDNFCKCLLEEDIQLANYQSHLAIKMPLSN